MFATIPPPPQRLLVFARLPEPGAAYEEMLRELIGSIGESSPETEIEFLWAPSPHANGELLRRAFAHHTVAMQTGNNLGERLSMAFSERFFFHRTEKIVAIGVDDPALPRALIDDAFALLDSCEYVVGPAKGGSYYLIGCRALSFDPAVFASRVLAETVQQIRALGSTLALLPERSGIDTVD